MKAVDPTATVSIISDGGGMVPKVDTSNGDCQQQDRGDQQNNGVNAGANSGGLNQCLSGSPVKNSQVNGIARKENSFENGDSIVKQKHNGSPARGVFIINGSGQKNLSKGRTDEEFNKQVNFSVSNGCCRSENGVVNGKPSSKKLEDKSISNSVRIGVVNNGYYKNEDEANEKTLTDTSLESLTDLDVEDGKGGSSLPENIPRYLGQDSGLESAGSSWAEAREHAVSRLQEELGRARDQLKLRDEEVERLLRIRQEVESELEDLTASLFQEAHKMVKAANERQAAAEKALRESSMQVEVLTAEVAALKTLVLTSTPARPNPHLHPQIDPKAKDDSATSGSNIFRKHRRSPSHFNLKYGRESSPPESPVKESRPIQASELNEGRDLAFEVDPVLHREFVAWKESPSLEETDPFIARVYAEDINSCLSFSNTELAARVREAVQGGTIYVEAVTDKATTSFPKKCALLESPRHCQYRMRLGETDVWHCISQICRNRIIAVCDFLNYLKYIQRGLVKSSVHDVYWEIVRLRKEMVLARLGLPLST